MNYTSNHKRSPYFNDIPVNCLLRSNPNGPLRGLFDGNVLVQNVRYLASLTFVTWARFYVDSFERVMHVSMAKGYVIDA